MVLCVNLKARWALLSSCEDSKTCSRGDAENLLRAHEKTQALLLKDERHQRKSKERERGGSNAEPQGVLNTCVRSNHACLWWLLSMLRSVLHRHATPRGFREKSKEREHGGTDTEPARGCEYVCAFHPCLLVVATLTVEECATQAGNPAFTPATQCITDSNGADLVLHYIPPIFVPLPRLPHASSLQDFQPLTHLEHACPLQAFK